MIFGIIFALIFILLFIRLITYIMRLGYTVAVVIDMLLIGGVAIYYAHHQWFVHIASGKAVYFWDVVLFLIIFFLYGAIIMIGTNKFPKLAALFHYIIAWVVTFFIYALTNYAIFDEMGALLDHTTMNEIVHLIIITLLAFIIFNTRMRMFKDPSY